MTGRTLVFSSLRHYGRTHLGVAMGVGVATAVLVGALLVGSSVNGSLRDQALNRVGGVHAALVLPERWFGADLADRISAHLGDVDTAPVIRLRGIAGTGSEGDRAGIVDVHGVDARFFALAPKGGRGKTPGPGEALLNARLAAHLGVNKGAMVLLRVEKPSFMPRDLAMSTIDDISFAIRVRVGGVIAAEDFGDFGLRANQVPPFNVFLDLGWLQRELELGDSANVVLVGGGPAAGAVSRADAALRATWTSSDAGLRLRELSDPDYLEIRSTRVFIEEPFVNAAAQAAPELVGVLTYFVNGIRNGTRTTPYSMVSAVGPLDPERPPSSGAMLALADLGPIGAEGDGITLNGWLQRDLMVEPGDSVELTYYVMGPDLRLREEARSFRVQRTIPLEGAAADPSLMPDFPGMTDTEDCRDWESDLPLDLSRVRDTDETYWDDHEGTPKAFVSLAAGQGAWSNRFGTLTSIRGSTAVVRQLLQSFPRSVDPARLGFFFRDMRGKALAAGAPTTDFGGLFIGLSLFLVASALILVGMLFVFGVEQRAGEIGLLLAVGFRPSRIRLFLAGEALVLALVGGVFGAAGGVVYTQGVLAGLGTLWQDAVAGATITLHAPAGTVLGGVALSVAVSAGAMMLALRRAFRRPALVLLSSRGGTEERTGPQPHRSGRVTKVLAVTAPASALALVLVSGTGAGQAAGAFFGAGALFLIGGAAASRIALLRMAAPARPGLSSLAALGARNSGRRAGRSLATIALLASGTFLVVAVQAFRLEPPGDAWDRGSGTGGFALFGRSTLPVLRDLSTSEGRDAFGIQAEELRDVGVVPLRVRDGDDASCLNLNRPQNPRLVGVRPEDLAERGCFTFADTLGESSESPWNQLNYQGTGPIPVIGDEASVKWALHLAVGDELEYRDASGNPFRVVIVGTVRSSILQGSLFVSDAELSRRFPGSVGYSMFLVDAPREQVDAVESTLSRALADVGLELTPTADRLQAFNAVQNTYLLIFQALGALGLLLGTVGMGMVVLRNALERRSELAVLGAVGFSGGAVRSLVFYEHALLVGLGLGLGLGAALIAILPGMASSHGIAFLPLFTLVGAVALSAVLWVWLSSRAATRGGLLDALREE